MPQNGIHLFLEVTMKLLVKRILSHLPTPLPVGVTEFNQWADSIIELSGRFADDASLRQALANMVIHASPLKGTDTPRASIPKAFFVKGLRKGAANQVASYVFQEIRTKQMADLEALKAAAEAEKQKLAEQSLGEATAGITPANEEN